MQHMQTMIIAAALHPTEMEELGASALSLDEARFENVLVTMGRGFIPTVVQQRQLLRHLR